MQAIYKTNKQTNKQCNKLKCMKGNTFPHNSLFFIFFSTQNVPKVNVRPGKGRGKSRKENGTFVLGGCNVFKTVLKWVISISSQ